MLKIDKGIPLPINSTGKGGHPTIRPYSTMEIGDSFLVETDDKVVIATTRASAHRFGKYNNKGMSVRMVPGGVRVWRVR